MDYLRKGSRQKDEKITIKWADLGTTNPASINRLNGILTLNYKVFPFLPDISKKYIYLHELGHYYLNTNDEFEADEFALKNFVGTEEKSLKKSVEGMARGLSGISPQHNERVNSLLQKALLIDYVVNKNKNVLKYLPKNDIMNYETLNKNTYESEFLGLGSKAKKAHKNALKAEYGSDWRQIWKQEKQDAGGGGVLRKQFRAEDKANKQAQAMQAWGINASSQDAELDAMIESMTNEIKSGNTDTVKKTDNTLIYVAVAMVIGVVIFLYFKNKK